MADHQQENAAPKIEESKSFESTGGISQKSEERSIKSGANNQDESAHPQTNGVAATPPAVVTSSAAQSVATTDSSDDLAIRSTDGQDLKSDDDGATPSPPKSKAVDPERKEKLLLMARKDRVAWIQKASLPYKLTMNHSQDPWSKDPSLATLKASHVGSRMPSSLKVLQTLCNSGLVDSDSSSAQNSDSLTSLGERVQLALGEELGDVKALPSGAQLLKSELEYRSHDDVLKAYNHFLGRLKDPAASGIVQGMRTFCRNLQDDKESKELSRKLVSYTASTFRTLQSHLLWRKDSAENLEWTRRSFDSFVYSQCRSHVASVVFDIAAQTKDSEWLKKLTSLQFVSPEHLEIKCLESSDQDLSDLLSEPIEALRSVDLYSAPYEKLQRVLVVYKAINATLSAALNKGRKGETKLPSADDVLPALILTILRGQPPRLHMNMQMVEEFLAPEYLRGEAGYAFTNLYGAVQFLAELDLSDVPQSLTISADDFRKGLKACRDKAEAKLMSDTKTVPSSLLAPTATVDISASLHTAKQIPVAEVRAARLRGETVDLNWALEWWKKQDQEAPDVASDYTSRDVPNPLAGLPAGFSRNYGFLTSRPESIRLADLGPLLSEYRMLVKATETLVSERESQAWAERKAELQAKQLDVYSRAKEVDPSLLPSSPSNRKSK